MNLVPRGGSAPRLVSGDAKRMANVVDRALHDIVATAGGMDAAAAHAYVNELIKNHRYVRDVY
jgi:sulfite reductase (NADPH) flavoprotein alpha-component